jgi:polyisoprenoid-binding protein YceI
MNSTATLKNTGIDTQKSITWISDPAHSFVQFGIRHMMFSEVQGRFIKFRAALQQPNEDFTGSVIDAVIETASITTENEDRDAHLRSAEFFDADKYPEITFVGTSFKQVSDDRYTIAGDLNLHGVTKRITLNASYLGAGKDPWGNDRIGFKGTAKLNRYDFGLQWNQALEAGGILVGKEVEITLVIQFVREN